MKVILTQELYGKGGEGDVVDVAPGYANNYLYRQGIAIPATKGNLKQLEMKKANIAKREEKRLAEAKEMQAKLSALTVYVDAQVGEEGVLFGSVTTAQIVAAIAAAAEVEVDRRRVSVEGAIKKAGEHTATVSIYRDIKAEVKLLVGVEPEVEVEEEAPEAEAEEAVEAPVEE